MPDIVERNLFRAPCASSIHRAAYHTRVASLLGANAPLGLSNILLPHSQVASFSKGSGDIKFTEDTDTKHDAASVAVTEAAQKFLYPDFYRLKGMQDWPED